MASEILKLSGKKLITIPETNSSPLKMDGWKMQPSFWGPAYFQGAKMLVSGEGNICLKSPPPPAASPLDGLHVPVVAA